MRPPRQFSTKIARCVCVLAVASILLTLAARVESAPKKTYKRVKPDTSKVNTGGIFFNDIFREGLVGDRPASLGSGAGNVASGGGNTGGNVGGSDPLPMPVAGGNGWAALISATTLEDEIKRIKLELDKDVTTPTEFNGLGHKKCRKNFSVLGLMFAVTSEYDGNVRWKDDAPLARDLFSRAGRNCKVATPASYNESKQRKEDLAAMVGGSKLESNGPAPAAETDWSQACERSELMKRIEAANKKLKELSSNAGAFTGGAAEAKHEAEMLAAISTAMMKDGMPDAGDEDYEAFCKTIKNSAVEIIESIKLKSADGASKALGNISKACDDCHETYRG